MRAAVRSRETIVRELAQMLRGFEGREYGGEIGPETLFFAELGMNSIDAVVLGEKIEERYGKKFPFRQFLTGLRDRGAADLSVGALADFLLENM